MSDVKDQIIVKCVTVPILPERRVDFIAATREIRRRTLPGPGMAQPRQTMSHRMVDADWGAQP